MNDVGHPILSCAEAHEWETRLFGGDEAKEWPAMQRAGRAVADAVLRDFDEIGGFPADGRILVLVGKGHNGGDALIAARVILGRFPGAAADVLFVFGERSLRPLAARAWRELMQAAPSRVVSHRIGRDRWTRRHVSDGPGGPGLPSAQSFALCLDGVFGFQFRPPVSPEVAALFAQVEALPIRLRAAIDLPSGLNGNTQHGDPVFRADFTYATGCVKAPLINGLYESWVGRLRYLNLDFFASDAPASRLRVLTPGVLSPLAGLRAPGSDKRTYGNLFVIGGSRSYPGAALMAVQAALRSGAGLVTAFVPESLAAAFAAQVPEAMWVGWPETPAGGLASEGQHLLQARLERATALLVGPGLARDPETHALAIEVVRSSTVPLVLDADALQPEIVRVGGARRVLTPHLGELRRMLAGDDFYQTSAGHEAVVVVKGRLTCVTAEGGRTGCYSPFGGPVLARGGSGDLLAGMIGAQLAQTPTDPLLAAARGVVWHGLAADALARAHGQVAVRTTQVLDYLGAVLREV